MIKHWYNVPKCDCYRVIITDSNGNDYCKSHVHDDFGNLVPTSAFKGASLWNTAFELNSSP